MSRLPLGNPHRLSCNASGCDAVLETSVDARVVSWARGWTTTWGGYPIIRDYCPTHAVDFNSSMNKVGGQ